MIELTFIDFKDYNDALKIVNGLLYWLATYIATKSEETEINLEGVLCVYDPKKPRYAALLMCEGLSEQRINEILKNPPGEYKGKYVACFSWEEPTVVSEIKPAEENTCDDKEEKQMEAAAT